MVLVFVVFRRSSTTTSSHHFFCLLQLFDAKDLELLPQLGQDALGWLRSLNEQALASSVFCSLSHVFHHESCSIMLHQFSETWEVLL